MDIDYKIKKYFLDNTDSLSLNEQKEGKFRRLYSTTACFEDGTIDVSEKRRDPPSNQSSDRHTTESI